MSSEQEAIQVINKISRDSKVGQGKGPVQILRVNISPAPQPRARAQSPAPAQPAASAQAHAHAHPAPAPQAPSQAGGGGGNAQSPAGGGGNNDGFIKKIPFPLLIVLVLLVIAVIYLVFMFLQGYTLHYTAEQVMPDALHIAQMEKQINEIQAQSNRQKQKIIETIPTKDCSTEEKLSQFLAQDDTVTLKDNTAYRLASGCRFVRIDTYVERFDASGYSLLHEDASSNTGFRGCGTIHGFHDSSHECTHYLNANRGKRIRVSIQNGGFVNIN